MIYNTIEAALKDITKEVEEAAEKTLQEAGEYARDKALTTDKFKVSDTFRNATQFHTLDKYHGFVLADKPYAEYLEFGNDSGGPFIYPKTAKALHWKSGGKDIFAKKVRSHPGYYFMENAGEGLDQVIEDMFIANLNIKE